MFRLIGPIFGLSGQIAYIITPPKNTSEYDKVGHGTVGLKAGNYRVKIC